MMLSQPASTTSPPTASGSSTETPMPQGDLTVPGAPAQPGYPADTVALGFLRDTAIDNAIRCHELLLSAMQENKTVIDELTRCVVGTPIPQNVERLKKTAEFNSKAYIEALARNHTSTAVLEAKIRRLEHLHRQACAERDDAQARLNTVLRNAATVSSWSTPARSSSDRSSHPSGSHQRSFSSSQSSSRAVPPRGNPPSESFAAPVLHFPAMDQPSTSRGVQQPRVRPPRGGYKRFKKTE
jgi:hypothetical protein